MPKLVPISAEKLIKILLKLNFEVIKIKGSHHFLMRNSDKKTTTVPVHKGEIIGQGLLRQILRDIELTVEEYENVRLKK